jgi:hypothetical protein
MADPWAFGWTQVFTLIGLLIPIGIALFGFRTFERWHREKIEEKRIDTAIEALALVYESKFIFDNIRSPMSFDYEWKDMPEGFGTEQERNARGPFYAILKRIAAHKDFFERAWKMQVRCTALFSPSVEETFLLMHRARREIEVSAEMLLRDLAPTHRTEENLKTWDRFRADVWGAHGAFAEGGDLVGQKLTEFRTRMEALCRPIIDRQYGRVPRQGLSKYLRGWRQPPDHPRSPSPQLRQFLPRDPSARGSREHVD